MTVIPFETQSVRRGRHVLLDIVNAVSELIDRGKTPTRVVIGGAVADDMRAFYDFATEWDGVLPTDVCGLPIVYETGPERFMRVDHHAG